MLSNISYRYKIPASIIAVIVITALAVAAPLISSAREAAKRDLIEHALSLGKTLSRSLQPALLHDELWQAYEIVTTPFDQPLNPAQHKQSVIVLDHGGLIYISTDPRRFPSTEHFARLDARSAKVSAAIADQGEDPLVIEDLDPDFTMMAIPVLAIDKTRLGTVIIEYSKDILQPRFVETLRRTAYSTALILLVLVPLGWLWGKRIAHPLLELSGAIAKVPKTKAAAIQFTAPSGNDEIGILGRRFEEMLAGLREKAALERKVVASERLAAVGRLTAGIAHEINNPLGGMLNAISTFKRQGAGDPSFVERTMSLLERGLAQIKDSVAALLVEARLATHALAPQDIEDVKTLVLPELERKDVALDWRNELTQNQTVPSTEVRQILLNLLLNAVEGADDRGRVRCHVATSTVGIELEVENDGPGLSVDQREHLFEPFAESRSQGKGLGLWMTYQLVTQLRGRIEARSRPGQTVFNVLLPVS
jgi:two-component system, NtrC family, sensor kinase